MIEFSPQWTCVLHKFYCPENLEIIFPELSIRVAVHFVLCFYQFLFAGEAFLRGFFISRARAIKCNTLRPAPSLLHSTYLENVSADRKYSLEIFVTALRF